MVRRDPGRPPQPESRHGTRRDTHHHGAVGRSGVPSLSQRGGPELGTLFTRAGKHDQTLDWLEKAYEAHDPNMPYLSVDPIFDDLRDNPRVQDLLRKLNLTVLLAGRQVLE